MGCASSAGVRDIPSSSRWDGFSQKYTLTNTIGEGSFGQVHAAWSVRSRQPRAVKILDLRGSGRGEVQEKLARAARHELKIWKQVGKHSHCVELLDFQMTASLCYLVMERCEASIMDRISEIARLPDSEVARIFREMLYGIEHLHGQGIVHRDCKPNNFLLGSENPSRVKICDFGLATTAPKAGTLLQGCYGTAPYMSPEMVGECGHTFSTDMWSYAVCVYTMIFREFPYTPREHTSKAMKLAVLQGRPGPRFVRAWPRPVSEPLEAFSRSLMVRDPAQRRSATEALQLEFLHERQSPNAKKTPKHGVSRKDSRQSQGSIRGVSDDSTQSGGLMYRRSTSTSAGSVARLGRAGSSENPNAGNPPNAELPPNVSFRL